MNCEWKIENGFWISPHDGRSAVTENSINYCPHCGKPAAGVKGGVTLKAEVPVAYCRKETGTMRSSDRKWSLVVKECSSLEAFRGEAIAFRSEEDAKQALKALRQAWGAC